MFSNFVEAIKFRKTNNNSNSEKTNKASASINTNSDDSVMSNHNNKQINDTNSVYYSFIYLK